MQLTIIYPDDMVVIDRVCQTFPLAPFKPPDNLHALQWSHDSGQIEYDDYTVDPIKALPDWATAMVDEFNRLRSVNQTLLKQQQQSALFVANGEARQERMRQQRIDQVRELFNDLVRMQ